MKLFLLLLLLPLCSGLPTSSRPEEFYIECYGHDFLMVINQELQCRSKVKQICYTRDSGEKGCTWQDKCNDPSWTCCDTNLCNA